LARYLAASPYYQPIAQAWQRPHVSPMAQLLVSLQILTLKSSVRFVADIASPLPKPRGGQAALAGEERFLRKRGSRLAQPADDARGVEERVYVGNDFFETAGDFNGPSRPSGAHADLGCLGDSKPYLKLGSHQCKRSLNRSIQANGIHGWLLSAPHMLAVRG